ncbi:MAG: GNAT family N-acetyltransferase [Eubacterium sp.]|nr:GNAT family N-acetyltransferase [Eubacterium sp.]
MIDIKISTKNNIDELMSIRLEMLKAANNLPEDYEYSDEMINESRDYFLNGDHLTVLALDKDVVIGCASMSFIRIMPTFEHPTGKRAHLMNVYTRSGYRRQGIARRMVELLIEKTWEKGATEISLDATTLGRPLYEKMGFNDSAECMVLTKGK